MSFYEIFKLLPLPRHMGVFVEALVKHMQGIEEEFANVQEAVLELESELREVKAALGIGKEVDNTARPSEQAGPVGTATDPGNGVGAPENGP